jgi:hypothetical protein
MANIGTLTGDQVAQQQQILRQQKMAEMLLQQGMQQPQGQMVSGHYVAPSFTQNLAGLANMYVGQRGIEKADKAQQDLARQLRADETAAMTDFMRQKQGTAGVQGGIYGPDNKLTTQTTADMYGANMELNPQYKEVAPVAPVAPNIQAAYANLYADPRASSTQRNLAFTKMNEGPMKVGVDDTLLDPNTFQPLYQGAGKLPATLDVAVSLIPNLPRNRNEWTDAQRQQVENKVLDLEKAKASITNVNLPSEGERKAGFMANILDRNILQMQDALGIDPKAVKPNVPASIVSAIAGENVLSRTMTPAQRQIVEDSQLDVLDAALTLRTGAAYTPVQLTAMRATYFPVLGDTPQAIKAKQQRLETLLEGAYINSGRATPPRVSRSIASQNTSPVIAPKVNAPANTPAANAPKFLGFEPKPTGN